MKLMHLFQLNRFEFGYVFLLSTTPTLKNMVHRKIILFIANKSLMPSHKAAVKPFCCIIIGHKVCKVFSKYRRFIIRQ